MMFNRTIQLALTLGALAAVPALATAQTGSSSQPQQGQQGGQGSSQKQDGAQQGGGQRSRGQQQQQQQGQKKQAQRIQETVSVPVEDGCRYTAAVNGNIQPASGGRSQSSQSQGGQGQSGGGAQGQRGGAQGGGSQAPAGGGAQQGQDAHEQGAQGQGAQERVIPDLTVVTSMNCPNAADVRVSETLKTDTPVTRTELQEMISRRASITTAKGGRLCMYVPQFELAEDRLTSRGVTQLCRVSPQEGQQQQEPKQGMR